MDNLAAKLIEFISRGSEGSSDGEVLNAVNKLRDYHAAQGTSLVEVYKTGSAGLAVGEAERTLNERLNALNDMLKTGKTVADYLKEIEILEKENSQLELKLFKMERDHAAAIAKLEKKLEKKILEFRNKRQARPQSHKPVKIVEFKKSEVAKKPKESINRPWTTEQFVWIIKNFITVDGDLATAKRTGMHDFDAIAAFNGYFNENVPNNGGAWRGKTNSIREWNSQKLLDKQPPEVLEALRKKGWNGLPSTRKTQTAKPKNKNNVSVHTDQNE